MSLPCCNCYLSYGRDMAQRYKGPRRQIKIGKSLPLSARHEIAARAAHHGIAFSQYVSDLLAIAAGMPELARELSQAALAIPPDTAQVAPPEWCSPRVPVPVYEAISWASVARGISRPALVAEVCQAHVDARPLPALDTTGTHTQEALFLTSA